MPVPISEIRAYLAAEAKLARLAQLAGVRRLRALPIGVTVDPVVTDAAHVHLRMCFGDIKRMQEKHGCVASQALVDLLWHAMDAGSAHILHRWMSAPERAVDARQLLADLGARLPEPITRPGPARR